MTVQALEETTTEVRSKQRYRRIVLAAGTSLLARGVSIGTSLVSIPLTLHYLGSERFGLWMTITSFLILLAFTDLGVGNGLVNAVAQASGKDDHLGIRRHVSSGMVILSVIATVLLGAFAFTHRLVAWSEVFNVHSLVAIREAREAVSVLVICLALGIPSGIAQRVQTGLQLGFLATLWQILASVFSFLALLFVVKLELGLPWLVSAVAGVPVIVGFVNTAVFFGWTHRQYAPGFEHVTRDSVRLILHAGLAFLTIQAASSVAFASDNIVLSRIVGAEAVTQYAVPDRLFALVPVLLGMVLTPLWPAYGEAASRGDVAWIKHAYSRSTKMSIGVAAFAAVALAASAHFVIPLWVGSGVPTPTPLLLTGFVIWTILRVWGNAVAMLLNGANVVRLQAVLAVAMAAAAIGLKIAWVRSFGLPGVVWATVVAYTIFTFVPITFAMPAIVARFQTRQRVGKSEEG